METLGRCLVLWLVFLVATSAQAQESRTVQFSRFSVELPAGWDGDEQTGFISDNPEEYSLTLGHKDQSGDNFISQVTIYLLPNKPGVNAREAAKKLTEAQGDSTEPVQDGIFWSFRGEPRSRTIKGMATTFVNADPDTLLIIIAQDPENMGAEALIDSLRGLTPKAKQLLGR